MDFLKVTFAVAIPSYSLGVFYRYQQSQHQIYLIRRAISCGFADDFVDPYEEWRKQIDYQESAMWRPWEAQPRFRLT